MLCPKRCQLIKHGFFKTFLYFSFVLIYKVTTAKINSSKYIILEKNIILYYDTVLLLLPKNCVANDDPCFLAWSQCPASGILLTDFYLAFFSERNRMLHRMRIQMCNAGIDDQKCILTTVLWENI